MKGQAKAREMAHYGTTQATGASQSDADCLPHRKANARKRANKHNKTSRLPRETASEGQKQRAKKRRTIGQRKLKARHSTKPRRERRKRKQESQAEHEGESQARGDSDESGVLVQ